MAKGVINAKQRGEENDTNVCELVTHHTFIYERLGRHASKQR